MSLRFFPLAPLSLLIVGILADQPVHAALIDQSFTVNNPDDALSGSPFQGSFRYDNAALTGVGDEDLSLDSFTFAFLGQNFSDATAGTVLFADGTFLGLSLSAGTPGADAIAFSFIPGFSDTSDASFSYDLRGSTGEVGFADLTYRNPATIPTPALLPGLMGLGLGVWRKRQCT
jgi:hypothetical protein